MVLFLWKVTFHSLLCRKVSCAECCLLKAAWLRELEKRPVCHFCWYKEWKGAFETLLFFFCLSVFFWFLLTFLNKLSFELLVWCYFNEYFVLLYAIVQTCKYSCLCFSPQMSIKPICVEICGFVKKIWEILCLCDSLGLIGCYYA